MSFIDSIAMIYSLVAIMGSDKTTPVRLQPSLRSHAHYRHFVLVLRGFPELPGAVRVYSDSSGF